MKSLEFSLSTIHSTLEYINIIILLTKIRLKYLLLSSMYGSFSLSLYAWFTNLSSIKFICKVQVPMKTCEDCGGSGICSECKGEGFVLKKLSDESAERARITSKNMATRYTAAYVSFWISTPSSFLTSFFPFPNW